MAVTSNDVANEAILIIGGNQPFVTGQNPTWDNSTVGKALQKLYTPAVQTVGRQFGWDFARNLFTLVLSGNPANLLWPFEYLYPGNGVQVWQLIPGVITDANDPLPTNWLVGNTLVGGVQTKVIWSNTPNAVSYYNNNPTESTWDSLFREAVVRLLASELAMAIAGKPDVAQAMLEAGGAFESLGQTRSD
jgi:hypothetical protein